MESFIREYQIDDLSICDGLIDFFRTGLSRQLTGPGVIGANGLVDPAFKKSTDLNFSAIETRCTALDLSSGRIHGITGQFR